MIIRQLTISAFVFIFLFNVALAGQPAVWETSGRTELLKGDARGISISDTGVLMLAPKLTEVFNTQQTYVRSEEHTSELQSLAYLVCRLLLEKKKRLPH